MPVNVRFVTLKYQTDKDTFTASRVGKSWYLAPSLDTEHKVSSGA